MMDVTQDYIGKTIIIMTLLSDILPLVKDETVDLVMRTLFLQLCLQGYRWNY